MSKVEELVNTYNPNGVLFDQIGHNVISLPKEILKNNYIQKDGDYPVINSGKDIQGFYNKYNNDGDAFTVASRGESAGFIQYSDIKFWAGGLCYPYRAINNNTVITKYLYYYLKKIEKSIMTNMVMRGGIPAINKSDFEKLTIPLPHIKVQEEIVKILDSFTNLIDALNEELSLRKNQFEYYREKLLTFDESNYVKISSICKRIVSGGTPKTTIDRYYQGNIPWLRTEEVDFCYVYETKKHITEEAIANSSTKMIPVNCVIIAMYGATAAKCCINKIPLCTNQACCNLEIDDTLALYKFVFYNICKEYEKLKSLGEGSQNNISGQKIKDYRIPIPSLAIQQSIVEKLDAFESLISSLKEEIALRQKQYEYYREKLLTFD